MMVLGHVAELCGCYSGDVYSASRDTAGISTDISCNRGPNCPKLAARKALLLQEVLHPSCQHGVGQVMLSGVPGPREEKPLHSNPDTNYQDNGGGGGWVSLCYLYRSPPHKGPRTHSGPFLHGSLCPGTSHALRSPWQLPGLS